MKTELILIGKTNDKLYVNGINDYTERITHYMPFGITTIPAIKNTKSLSEEQQKQMEGEQILKLIQASDTVVLLLAPNGKTYLHRTAISCLHHYKR